MQFIGSLCICFGAPMMQVISAGMSGHFHLLSIWGEKCEKECGLIDTATRVVAICGAILLYLTYIY
jgi:hypothetical protein